jgi:hypothetical protein
MGFYLTEVEFDAPALPIESGQVLGGNACLCDRCNKGHALGSKTLMDNAVADNADMETLWQGFKFFHCHFGGALSGTLPVHKHIKFRLLGKAEPR